VSADDDERLHAVLIEPQLRRLRELCGLGGVPLTASFEGWHRHAVLTPERVFLFPRDRSRVPGLRHEAAVLRALEGRGVPAPRLLGHWRDPRISPYPFIAVSRLPGRSWARLEAEATLDQVAALLEGLGRAIATWHRLDRRTLGRGLRRRQNDVEQFLTSTLEVAAYDVARLLGFPRRYAAGWLRAAAPVAALEPVLVHGDVNEGQILVDDDLRVTGILDWETAHLGHPLKDFDFGEWGYGIFAWDGHFDLLRRRLWEAYAGARGGALPSWRAVHLCFCLQVAYWLGRRATPSPWQRARLATTLDLLGRLGDEAHDAEGCPEAARAQPGG
jgi:aminoglycoside phosphotransferase (APT) family kinase protein